MSRDTGSTTVDIPAQRVRRFGLAWLALAAALALHVADEAHADFLSVYNPTVLAIRERIPWIPLPTFTFGAWITGLAALVPGVLSSPVMLAAAITALVCAVGVVRRGKEPAANPKGVCARVQAERLEIRGRRRLRRGMGGLGGGLRVRRANGGREGDRNVQARVDRSTVRHARSEFPFAHRGECRGRKGLVAGPDDVGIANVALLVDDEADFDRAALSGAIQRCRIDGKRPQNRHGGPLGDIPVRGRGGSAARGGASGG